jgi:hypothetical protein
MHTIYIDVLRAMQQAKEVDGLGFDEYITLMNMIAKEATIRAKNAINLSKKATRCV